MGTPPHHSGIGFCHDQTSLLGRRREEKTGRAFSLSVRTQIISYLHLRFIIVLGEICPKLRARNSRDLILTTDSGNAARPQFQLAKRRTRPGEME